MKLLHLLRAESLRPKPLPAIRPTSEILSDIDQQVGRLEGLRERAADLIKQMESADEQAV